MLAAFLFHAEASLLPGGFTGADIFFVISGYLITGIILRDHAGGSFRLLAFYERRTRRILPALLVVLSGGLAVGWRLLGPPEYAALGQDTAASALFYQNLHLWRHTGYFEPAGQYKPLLHLWSLGVEEQFYVLWPVAVLVMLRWRRFLPWMMLAAMLVSFAHAEIFQRSDRVGAYYLLTSRFWELAVGGWLAAGRVRLMRGKNVASALGCILLLLSVWVVHADRPYTGWWAWLPISGTALVIAAGPDAWLNARVLSLRPVVYIGLVSYPLYLWHWPILAYGRIMMGEDFGGVALLPAAGLAFVLSVVTYHGLETPLRRKASVQRGRRIAATLLVLLALVAAAGYGVMFQKGIPRRFPEEVRRLISTRYDYNTGFRSGLCHYDSRYAPPLRADCVDQGFQAADRVSLLLWGDSHAAQLYPGLKALQQKRPELRVAQYSLSGCPPLAVAGTLMHAVTPTCSRFYSDVVRVIRERRPDAVLLAALWEQYLTPDTFSYLGDMLAFLRAEGVRHVYVMGHVPRWKPSLPDLVLKLLQKDLTGEVPARLRSGLVQANRDMDRALRAYVEASGARYLSAYDILCNDKGCMVGMENVPEMLTTWDYGHLSVPASALLMRAHADTLLAP